MGTERRFTLLFLCAFALVMLLGVARTHQGRARLQVAAVDSPSRSGPAIAAAPHDAAGPSVSGVPAEEPFLAGLWAVRLSDRFPALIADTQAPVIDDKQVISYYGNPYTPDMGVLGTADLETIGSELKARAARYDQLNGDMGVIPAIHLVYGVAQYHPTNNGLYLQYVADEDVRRYLDFTERHGMLLFLDLQIGKSSVVAEIRKALPYLRYPQVHLAIDPEFAVTGTEVPGSDLGSLRSKNIDEAQALLQNLVDEDGLPPKILIVHQFTDTMLPDAESIRSYASVELIFDMDGFGPAAVKRAKYQQLAARPYAVRTGIKLFFQHDPDLMSEEDVLRLQPAPALVIYQ